MQGNYSDFSYVYDKLISDVDYKKLCSFLLSKCKEYSHTPHLVLDAACGTGNFTKQLCESGFDVIGVDNSIEMLSVAQSKVGNSCSLICQDLCELDLYGTIDTVFCTLDSLNHIIDYDNFKKAIARMSLFLEPGGLMFFDVNTVYKHKHVLGNNTFVQETDEIFMTWQNTLCEDNVINFNMDFFVLQDDGKYIRLCENFDEKAYSESQIYNALDEAGLEILEIKDFSTYNQPTDKSEKLIYITRKVK